MASPTPHLFIQDMDVFIIKLLFTIEAIVTCCIPCEETIILPYIIQQQREQDYEFIAEQNPLWDSEGDQKHISLPAHRLKTELALLLLIPATIP